jgi:CheY-like chemotaxis protein
VYPTEEVHQIKEVAIRASEIVRELMIYSGQEGATLQPVDLSDLVQEMSGLLKTSISNRSLLRLDLSRELPPVLGNATQIRQLVMNLVINASQAIGERDGVIHVRTSVVRDGRSLARDGCRDSDKDFVRLEVGDTGCGMTEEEKAKIFDPFFTTKPAGHGLGLAVVQGIVQSHGGAITVFSTPGKGSTFEVLFRCDSACREMAPSVSFEAHVETPAPVPGTVLLVEDEDGLRIAVTAALRNRGFSVVSAADGTTAVELFRGQAHDIGVVILDLRLPGLPGQEVFRQIRAIKPGIKVMFTSAYDATIANAVSDHCILKFLQKPYKFADLFSELRRVLSVPPEVLPASHRHGLIVDVEAL